MAYVLDLKFHCVDCGRSTSPRSQTFCVDQDAADVYFTCCGRIWEGRVSGETVHRAKLTPGLSLDPVATIELPHVRFTRAEKIAKAKAGIAAGEYMKVTPHRRADANVIRQALRETTMFHNFWMQQRHDVPLKTEATLSACDKVIASAEWSRQLREKVTASKHAEKHQVLCDIQDIE